MQIDKLEIENFRLFRQAEFHFHPQFNLIVGLNGSGKTSLLRALAVALGGWAHAYFNTSENHRLIEDGEVREVYQDQRFDKASFAQITATGRAVIIDRNQEEKEGFVVWRRRRESALAATDLNGTIRYGDYPQEYPLSFRTLGNDTLTYIDNGQKFSFPLIAFYECDRIWRSSKAIDAEESAQVRYSRFDAYRDCFHTGANHTLLAEWLLKNELASLQKKTETPILASIRAAARGALDGCTDLRYDFEEGRVVVEFEGGKIVPFEHLSDGQRTMLGLFCDIARRAAILNPHLAGDASQKTTGIVLIDELDLHLHPRWQRQIIQALRNLFPLIQFICTTHSPFLIQALHNGKLLMLDRQDAVDFANMSIEDIVEVVQGIAIPQRSQRHQAMQQAAEAYFTLLRQASSDKQPELARLKQELDRLAAPFADDPAYQAMLNVERIAALGDKNS